KNIYNIDKIRFLLGFVQSVKVITSKLYKNGTLISHPGNQQMITVLEAICVDGSYLEDPIINFKGDSLDESWINDDQCSIPDNILVSHSSNGWTNNGKSLTYLVKFFGSRSITANKVEGEYWMLIFDGHASHVCWNFLSYYLSNKIIPFYLPSYTSHKLQPLDVAVFSHFK
ncbi:hypothetical protein L873DRAFT_1697082, partial [Choiromyces venosus 120613-1]